MTESRVTRVRIDQPDDVDEHFHAGHRQQHILHGNLSSGETLRLPHHQQLPAESPNDFHILLDLLFSGQTLFYLSLTSSAEKYGLQYTVNIGIQK